MEERARRLFVIEGVHKREALVEELLRFGIRRRDRVVVIAETARQRRSR
jgi:hypothetical protein